MDLSFEEKSAWITLGALVVTFTIYFWLAAHMLAAGVTEMAPYLPVFLLTVILQVVILVAGHTAAAILARPEGRDERDRLIAWRAEHHSAWLLGAGTLVAVFALALPGIERAWVANGLLAALVLSEILDYGLRVAFYRRGL